MPGIIPGVPKSKGNKGFYLDVVEKEELPKVLWDFGKEFPNFGRWDGIPKRATGFSGMFKAGFAWNKGMGGIWGIPKAVWNSMESHFSRDSQEGGKSWGKGGKSWERRVEMLGKNGWEVQGRRVEIPWKRGWKILRNEGGRSWKGGWKILRKEVGKFWERGWEKGGKSWEKRGGNVGEKRVGSPRMEGGNSWKWKVRNPGN